MPTYMIIRIISIICFLTSGYIINKVIPPKRRNIIMFIIVLTICVITGIISIVQEGKYRSENRIARLEEKLGNIYFQGKVISSFTKYKEVLLCILIDTTNTPYYYTYARDLALRIENGIAVMPIGMLDTFDTKSVFKNNAEYVIVNKDKNSEINFIIKTDTLTVPLIHAFWPGKLDKKYMTVFDEIIYQNKPKVLE